MTGRIQLLTWAYTRPCFLCDAVGVCKHREPSVEMAYLMGVSPGSFGGTFEDGYALRPGLHPPVQSGLAAASGQLTERVRIYPKLAESSVGAVMPGSVSKERRLG